VTEPLPTAVALAATGILLAVSVVFSRTSGRLGIPVALLFLAVGMAAGSEGIGRIHFEDYSLAFRVGTVALVLILFDGGLNTPVANVRRVFGPATVLATVGVAGTAALIALGARVVGLPWPEALLLGAVVSSTDAAAVFGVLRSARIQIRRRVGLTLEVESGANDPVAVILTLSFTQALAAGERPGLGILLEVLVQMGVGLAAGLAIGWAGRWVLGRARLAASGLYPVLTLAIAFVAFGAPTLLHGSGFLAVYVAAVVLGNGPLPYLPGLRRVHDAMAWFSQVSMFLLLGLLAFPSRIAEVARPGLALGLFVAFVARPAVVALCLLPFRYTGREIAFIAWVGLRGAVPIILATYPVLANVPGAQRVFDLVFFIVVVSVLVQGGSIRPLARRLELEVPGPPAPKAVLEILSTQQQLGGEVLSFYVEPASAVAGSRISDLPFPERSAVMLVVRGRDVVAARGRTTLQPGDHVYVFAPPEEKGFVQLLFGRAEEA
jgi:cell volume regulation protein A